MLFAMPQLGSTMEEGTILKWLKREGEVVRKGEALLEIETDKATMEVESPVEGTLLKQLHPQDAVVSVQTPIAVLGQPGEQVQEEPGGSESAALTKRHPRQAASNGPALSVQRPAPDAEVYLSPRARRLAEQHSIAGELLSGRGTGPQGRVVERDVAAYIAASTAETIAAKPVRSTPLAAKLAEDLGIDMNDLAYGLPGSRVRSADILKHAGSAPTQSATLQAGSDLYDARPFEGMRKRIADNVARSRSTAPHVTLTIEVDMTECASFRTRIIPEIEKVYGTRLTYTDIFVKAAARALVEHTCMNAALVGDELRVYRRQNIGVAVALDEGLVVPVVRDAAAKTVGAISAELKPLIDRARTGKFTPDDVGGGTFTITNLGGFGIDQFDPIIVSPQAGILGVCRIADKAVAINGVAAVRAMMNLCLSFDHRVVDGAPAAKFLQRIKELLENPIVLLF